MEFDRTTSSLHDAITSAITEVEGAGVGVRAVRVESEDANTIAKISADLLRVTSGNCGCKKRRIRFHAGSVVSPSKSIFLSHSSHNDPFVEALRVRLQNRGYTVLEDSSFLVGDVLRDRVKGYIDNAHHVIGVVSQQAVASGWVKRELRYARGVAQQREGYRIIPLLLPPAGTPALREIFELPEPEPGADLDDWPAELVAIGVSEGAGAIDALMPALIDALEGKVAGYVAAPEARSLTPLADLRLRLRNPRFELVNDGAGVEVPRPVAEASLAFFPPGAETPEIESPEFTCVAPLGKLEEGDLTFYLERYHITPFGNFTRRAEEIESRLPEWGQDLWDALRPDDPQHAAAVNAWRKAATTAGRRFTVEAPPVKRLRGYPTDRTDWTDLTVLNCPIRPIRPSDRFHHHTDERRRAARRRARVRRGHAGGDPVDVRAVAGAGEADAAGIHLA